MFPRWTLQPPSSIQSSLFHPPPPSHHPVSCGFFVNRPCLQDMTNFYQQYKSIEPWLQTDKKPEGGKEFLQSPEDRKKLVREALLQRPRPRRYIPPQRVLTVILPNSIFRMACTSASCVPAAVPRAPRTGGTWTNTSARLHSCRRDAGWQTPAYVYIAGVGGQWRRRNKEKERRG